MLDNIIGKGAISTRRLDPRHSLHSRIFQIWRSPNYTRLSRQINSIPLSDLVNTVIFPHEKIKLTTPNDLLAASPRTT